MTCLSQNAVQIKKNWIVFKKHLKLISDSNTTTTTQQQHVQVLKDHVPCVHSPHVESCESKTRRSGHSDFHHCAPGAHIPATVWTAWQSHTRSLQLRKPSSQARPTDVHGGAQQGSESVQTQTRVDAKTEPTGWTNDTARLHWPSASEGTGRHSVAQHTAHEVHLHSGADEPDPERPKRQAIKKVCLCLCLCVRY